MLQPLTQASTKTSLLPQGFLLSRHSFDRGSTCIHYWLATSEGPVKLVIEGERPVFMVKVADRAQMIEVLEAAS